MKPWIFAPVVLTAVLGLPNGASEKQKAAIHREVLQAMRSMLALSEKLDVDLAVKLCQGGPEFAFAMLDGNVIDFARLTKDCRDMFATLTAQELTTASENVVVLGPDAAIYFWRGRDDLMQKDGIIQRSDPYAATYVDRKVNGEWKMIYGHESGLPFQPVKPAEIVTGTLTIKATFKGQDISGQHRFTDVYTKRDGRWQCVSTHGSLVAKN